MDKGLIQVYYGYGKGKTSAAVGSAVRAAGHDLKVFFYQFLKGPTSGEVKILKSIEQIEYMDNTTHNPFLFNLTAEQQQYYQKLYENEISQVKEKCLSGAFDMVVLDEAIDAYNMGLLKPEDLFEIMDKKPLKTELIITGHEYTGISIDEIKKRADYVTEMKKEKHPFDKGQTSRVGVEE